MTSLANLETAIIDDLRTIRDNWDDMLPALKAAPIGRGSSGGATVIEMGREDGDHNAGVGNLDIVLSDRGDITAVLQGWSRLVVEDFDVTTVIPHGHDVAGMTRFLERWARHMTGHDAAQDMADELRACAGKVLRHAKPRGRDFMILGECPIEIEHPDGSLHSCGGTVIAYPQAGSDRDPRCAHCGTEAVVDWWMSHMLDDPDSKPLVTASELISIIAFRLRWTVTHETVRKWASLGRIERAGKDSKGRTLYDHCAVVEKIRADLSYQRDRQAGRVSHGAGSRGPHQWPTV